MKKIILILLAIINIACEEQDTFLSVDIRTEFQKSSVQTNCEDSLMSDFLSQDNITAQRKYMVIPAAADGSVYGWQFVTVLQEDGIVVIHYRISVGQTDYTQREVIMDQAKGYFVDGKLVFSDICENDIVYEIL